MHTLHTVNKSPFEQATLGQCLAIAQPDHSLILIENGVYAALNSHSLAQQLQQQIASGLAVYALKDDIDARGLTENFITDIKIIDMSKFVQLCCKHSNSQSWY